MTIAQKIAEAIGKKAFAHGTVPGYLTQLDLAEIQEQFKLNLYLISQDEESGYDTYDSAVVCAANKDEAIKIHPGGKWSDNKHDYIWASSPSNVQAKLIGVASKSMAKGVVLASFNAG